MSTVRCVILTDRRTGTSDLQLDDRDQTDVINGPANLEKFEDL